MVNPEELENMLTEKHDCFWCEGTGILFLVSRQNDLYTPYISCNKCDGSGKNNLQSD